MNRRAGAVVAADPLAERAARLRAVLEPLGSVVIGYSGGVDSVYLAYAAAAALGAPRVLAVTGRSDSYPDVQRAQAVDCAHRIGIRHLEIETAELADPRYAANPVNRCYFCKTELWGRLRVLADAHGFAHVLDGSNADDASDHRPGAQAAREHGVRSPLLEAGLTKADIRALSNRAGLPTWDRPASPCLASRLPYGLAVTPERLRAIENAESAVRAVGLSEFRVRHHGDAARLETAPAELPTAFAVAGALGEALRAAGFTARLLDVEGYRRGALNETRGARAAGTGRADEGGLIQLRASGGAALARAAAVVRRAGLDASVSAAGHDAGVLVIDVPAHAAPALQPLAPALKACGFGYVTVPLGGRPAPPG